MKLWGLAVASLLCWASAAPAAGDDFEVFLTAARHLYDRLEYERALAELEQARKHARGPSDEVEVSLYEGVIQLELGRADDAHASFQTALYLSADARLPIQVSPKVAEAFERVRTEVKAELAKSSPSPTPVSPPTPSVQPAPDPDLGLALAVAPPAPPPRRWPWISVGAGAAVCLAGALALVEARSDYVQLTTGVLDGPTASRAASQGPVLQAVGDAAVGLGAAAVLVGAGALLFQHRPAPVALYSNGRMFGVAGEWP